MRSSTLAVLLGGTAFAALDVDVKNTCSIKDAAKLVAGNLLSYYNDQDKDLKITGLLPGPPEDHRGDYYWGESGMMWDTLISYWHETGDAQYNDLIAEGLLWQSGNAGHFLSANWTAQMGNDDQGFWAMAAMSAAEYGLPNEKAGEGKQWLEMATKVCHDFIDRWDMEKEERTCGGGLHWQIPSLNAGYDYKNSVSNGVFFNLAARLAKFTGNSTYAEWADKTWEWMQTIGFMDEEYNIFDGAHTGHNCTDINQVQFSYTPGIFLQGAAAMYNQSKGSDVWKTRTMGLLNRTLEVFIDKESGAPVEIACEGTEYCTTDMRAFKGILLRGMESASDLVLLSSLFEGTATAVAKTCDGKTGACGFVWTAEAGNDTLRGAGEQMNALSAFTVLLSAQAVSSSESVNKTCAVADAGSATGTGTGASQGTETGTGASASGSPSGTPPPTTPSGGTINGAGLGSVLGGLLLVAAFFA